MPEHLKALIVILVLATGVFVFAKAPACALASATGDFERRRNLWFGITLAAFLAHNFWIYIIVAAALLLFAVTRETNKLAMYFLLLFAVPPMREDIGGLGIIQYFFTMHYLRLLALAVLLPAYLILRKQPDAERFGRTLPDKLIAGYMILSLLLQLTVDSFTNTLRHGVFYAFTDIFLPYYVASRCLKDVRGFRDALMAFVIAALVLSTIAAFESARHWLLYSALRDAMGAQWGMGNYIERTDILRALGSTGHPIALGYVMAVATGFALFLKKSVPNTKTWGIGLVLLSAGLIASLSRGPWVGAAAILLIFVAMSPSRGLLIAQVGLLGLAILPVLLASPVGESIIDHLPFVGTVDEASVSYRQRLTEISVQVILQNPYFGTFDYLSSPLMQGLRQGEGIIDIVNSFVGVGLAYGLVGLSLYSGFFIAVAIGIFKGMRNLSDRNGELYLLGQVLFATLIGILVIIFTVSSISVIPTIYWAVAGLGVAYARMLALTKAPAAARPAGLQPAITKFRT